MRDVGTHGQGFTLGSPIDTFAPQPYSRAASSQIEEILLRVRNALERRRLKAEVHLLRAEVTSVFGFDGIVGVNEAFREIVATLPKIAQTDSTVLITGESGTGKELIARAIHTRQAGAPTAHSCR